MPPKMRNPAGGGSRSRVMNIDIPRRKLDCGNITACKVGSKGAERIVKCMISGFPQRVEGGIIFRYEYHDAHGSVIAPSHRVFRVSLGGPQHKVQIPRQTAP